MTTHVRATLPVAPAPRSTLDDFLLVMLPAALVAFLKVQFSPLFTAR